MQLEKRSSDKRKDCKLSRQLIVGSLMENFDWDFRFCIHLFSFSVCLHSHTQGRRRTPRKSNYHSHGIDRTTTQVSVNYTKLTSLGDKIQLNFDFFSFCFHLPKLKQCVKIVERNSTEECPSLKPTKWVKVGNIASLILYPIKSCKGIYVDKAFVTPLGLQGRKGSRAFRDRTFLVVNAKGREVCQEQFPTMVLIEPTILDDDRISLSAPNMEPLIFSLPENKPSNRTVCSLGKADKNIPCLDCGDEVARFFSEFLGKNLRLVNHIEGETKEFRQLTKDEIVYPTFTKDVLGVFQNESAYLLIADESVSELNKFMNVQSTHKNFRPTVLIENIQEPFGELKWSYAKLGSDDDAPVLKTGRPCDRYLREINH
ncbi:unnamed protein product [Allacma fusca]|uniref:Molybdenum cofactor sulfurase middle domain-containing protein n=1 Tax=Allacma fusca TaxID=39272 RepID=A0A8J2LP98_9HEXA|nr:unnamed protein product [Allacma fusca]